MKTEPVVKLSKAQQKVVDALRQTGTYLVHPIDSAGKRTGYVTTGGLKGWICPVALSVFKTLVTHSIIHQKSNGAYWTLSPLPLST